MFFSDLPFQTLREILADALKRHLLRYNLTQTAFLHHMHLLGPLYAMWCNLLTLPVIIYSCILNMEH